MKIFYHGPMTPKAKILRDHLHHNYRFDFESYEGAHELIERATGVREGRIIVLNTEPDRLEETQATMRAIETGSDQFTYYILYTATRAIGFLKEFSSFSILGIFYKDQSADEISLRMDQLKSDLLMRLKMQRSSIVVLDDDRLSLRVLGDIFRRYSFQNVTYYSDPEAFFADEETYDIYLIDLVLPGGISGERIIYDLRNRDQQAVILAVSSLEHEDIISKLLYLGADDYLVKPYGENLLLAKVYATYRYYQLLQENEEKTSALEEQVIRDGLTQLYNHKHMVERIQGLIDQGELFSVIMIDLDHFKQINDHYGHQVGDRVLVRLARGLESHFRDNDTVGRYGGEEFMVLMPGADDRVAAMRIGAFLENLNREPLYEELTVTFSAGVSTLQEGDQTKDVIRRADRALYVAKHEGRNQVKIL